MNTVIVRYRTKPEHADQNQRMVEAVFAELGEQNPEGIAYSSYRLEDGTFVHIAEVDGENPLASSDAFAAFQAGLDERCEEGPNPQTATLIGAYRFDASAAAT